MRRGIVVL